MEQKMVLKWQITQDRWTCHYRPRWNKKMVQKWQSTQNWRACHGVPRWIKSNRL